MYRLYKLISVLLFPLSKKLFLHFIGVRYGMGCRFVGLTRSTFGSEPYLIEFGNNVTVSSGVQFITHDGSVSVLRNEHPRIDLFDTIKIGDNVFIGHGSIIMPGTTIGNNVILGAGSLVRGTVPSDAIYAGIPAKYKKSIEEYSNQILPKVDQTKKLSFFAKKRYLLKKYNVK